MRCSTVRDDPFALALDFALPRLDFGPRGVAMGVEDTEVGPTCRTPALRTQAPAGPDPTHRSLIPSGQRRGASTVIRQRSMTIGHRVGAVVPIWGSVP